LQSCAWNAEQLFTLALSGVANGRDRYPWITSLKTKYFRASTPIRSERAAVVPRSPPWLGPCSIPEMAVLSACSSASAANKHGPRIRPKAASVGRLFQLPPRWRALANHRPAVTLPQGGDKDSRLQVDSLRDQTRVSEAACNSFRLSDSITRLEIWWTIAVV
jgi:hypothetical protein